MWTEIANEESLDDVFGLCEEAKPKPTARGPTAFGFSGAAAAVRGEYGKNTSFGNGLSTDMRYGAELPERKITYAVVGFEPDKYGKRAVLIVRERLNGFDVNEYRGYQRGGAALALWPKRKLAPSVLSLRKFTISIYDTVREY